MAVHRKG